MANDSKQSSVYSNWSDFVPIDMEAEYRRIYKSRKRPHTTVCTATTLSALATKAATIPPSSPVAKKTVKNSAGASYTKTKRMGKLAGKVTICF